MIDANDNLIAGKAAEALRLEDDPVSIGKYRAAILLGIELGRRGVNADNVYRLCNGDNAEFKAKDPTPDNIINLSAA